MVLGLQSHHDPWSHSHHSPSEACIHQSPRLHQTFLHQNLNLYLPNFLSGNYKPKYYFNFDISSVKFQWHSYHEAKHSLKVKCELTKPVVGKLACCLDPSVRICKISHPIMV